MRVREAGIGERAAASLARAHATDVDVIVRDLTQIDALLEESPFPRTSGPGCSRSSIATGWPRSSASHPRAPRATNAASATPQTTSPRACTSSRS